LPVQRVPFTHRRGAARWAAGDPGAGAGPSFAFWFIALTLVTR
jgi:hypothetical protein